MENSLKRLDHKMLQRTLLVVVGLLLLTGFIKNRLLILQGDSICDKQASKALGVILMNQKKPGHYPSELPKDFPKDGWGRSFYLDGYAHLLRSAGADASFHTPDDRLYPLLLLGCTQNQVAWILTTIPKSDWNFDSLPDGMSLDSTEFALREGKNLCYLPRIYGFDGISGTEDDWKMKIITNVHPLGAE
ncbi:MAG: hypothetical protein H3C47_01755 [Candidatus Cloacimonetes bacterium]|nr:hypothetical protein [Candidatus Cloacimonadota bacterium]